MKDYRITVNRPIYDSVLTFKTREDAQAFGAKKRKELAEDLKIDWMDLWFDIDDYESEDKE